VSVGVSRTGKTIVVFVELGTKVNSQYTRRPLYWWEGFWSGVTARHPCKMRSLVYKWMLQQDGVPSHITRSTACVKVLTSSSWTFGHRTTQIWIRWTVLFGETLQKTVLQCRSLKSLQELKSAIATALGELNCHKRSLAKVSANSGDALKMKYSVMADTLNNVC